METIPYFRLDTPFMNDVLTPLAEFCVGPASILPTTPPETNPNWIYFKWRRTNSTEIHISALDRRCRRNVFVANVTGQGIFTSEEAHLIYSIASAYLKKYD